METNTLARIVEEDITAEELPAFLDRREIEALVGNAPEVEVQTEEDIGGKPDVIFTVH